MRKKSKAIITCAITGSIHTPSMSPYLPVTPDEIAAQAIEAAEYYADVPPWNEGAAAAGMDASDGGFDAAVEDVEATIDTTGWKNGKHIVFVRAQDQDGNWGAVSAAFLSVYSR